MLYPVSIVAGTIVVLVWTYLLLARGGFWSVARNLFEPVYPARRVRIVAIVPARDEAATIADAVASLVNQRCCQIHVFVIDDASSDGTAQLARDAARRAGHPECLTVIAGQPLPPGWSGKLWAVRQGIEAARAVAPEYILLTDADVVHGPWQAAALAAAADGGGYDLASVMVTLHCENIAEKLLIPAFVFFFLMLYPPAWVVDPQRATAAAAGGCILIRPAALARAGGIEAIRSEIIDDCALARAVKRTGGRAWLGLSPDSNSVRRYGSLAEIGRMTARTAFNQLRHSTFLLGLTMIGMVVVYLAPIALLFAGRGLPVALGAAACAMMLAAYLPMVRFYGLNLVWALSLPAAALFYTGATVKSALDFWTGRGGRWKGRAQDVHAAEDHERLGAR